MSAIAKLLPSGAPTGEGGEVVPVPWVLTPVEAGRVVHDTAAPIEIGPRRTEPGTDQPADCRPKISADEEDLPRITAQCAAALQRANHPERLFSFGGRPCRLVPSDDGPPMLERLSFDAMRYELARAAQFYRVTWSGGEQRKKVTVPPKHVVADLLAMPEPIVPELDRIVSAPVFAADGQLQTTPGYHPASRSYFAPTPGFALQPVPVRPTAEDVARATQILEEILADFPFASEADRAHAVALFLLPFARALIAGPTPLHLVESPVPGSGKDLLIDCLLMAAIGEILGGMTEAASDEEWRKRLTAQLLLAPSVTILRNLRQRLDSGALAQALSGQFWEDRRLGGNEVIRVRIQCVWAASGNNPVMTTEQSRRTVRIRLDAGVERPWQRTAFRHPDLRRWAKEHRAELAWAALTLVQNWMAAGRPAGRVSLGSYEAWAAVLGGILDQAGIPAFLANRAAFYEAADLESEPWRELVASWWERFGEGEVGTAELFPLAQAIDGFDLPGNSERAQRTSFGRQLGQQRDRVFGEYRVERGRVVHSSQRWRLSSVRPLV